MKKSYSKQILTLAITLGLATSSSFATNLSFCGKPVLLGQTILETKEKNLFKDYNFDFKVIKAQEGDEQCVFYFDPKSSKLVKALKVLPESDVYEHPGVLGDMEFYSGRYNFIDDKNMEKKVPKTDSFIEFLEGTSSHFIVITKYLSQYQNKGGDRAEIYTKCKEPGKLCSTKISITDRSLLDNSSVKKELYKNNNTFEREFK